MTSPEIRELQMFLSLVKEGSFSGAAQQLGVTQPAVSAQILKLEQVIGFPLFYRCPEGTIISDLGKSLVPLVENVVREHADLLRRAAYWKRSQAKQMKIWMDGSRLSQDIRTSCQNVGFETGAEASWDMVGDRDWLSSLRSMEVDVVLAGSFLKAGDIPGIKLLAWHQQRGVTIAWNPAYYDFNRELLSLPDVISSTSILPSKSLAVGFRDFLSQWCMSLYGIALDVVFECNSEADAVYACKQGLGVMIFPGDAERRLNLDREGLQTVRVFEFILPKAFSYGVRYRADEKNPQILAMVEKLSEELRKLDCAGNNQTPRLSPQRRM